MDNSRNDSEASGETVKVTQAFKENFEYVTRDWSAADIEEARNIARHAIRRGDGDAVQECFAGLAADKAKGLIK